MSRTYELLSKFFDIVVLQNGRNVDLNQENEQNEQQKTKVLYKNRTISNSQLSKIYAK